MPALDKAEIVRLVVQRLRAELNSLTSAALESHADATDEQNKAENKYDTRGLEASYLAHGQSKAAEEAALAVTQFESLALRPYTFADVIGVGAVVTLDNGDLYFIGPRAGGTEVSLEGQTIMVVTPSSPLGRQLVGRHQGDTIMANPARRVTARIATVA